MFCFIVEEDVVWPKIDVLAAAATQQFHNNVIGSLMINQPHTLPTKEVMMNSSQQKRKVSCISTEDTQESPVKNFYLFEDIRNNISSLNMDSSFILPPEKKLKHSESKCNCPYLTSLPTPAALYKMVPQTNKATYKAGGQLGYNMFIML